MRFYEEFGLSRDATPDKIKESYHTLVRLLHPDQHADPAIKQAAELQMRRINKIYAVLSDPDLRRRYDAGYLESERPAMIVPAPPPPRKLPLSGLVWGGAAVAICGFVLWLADRDSGYSSPDSAFAGDPADQLTDKRSPEVARRAPVREAPRSVKPPAGLPFLARHDAVRPTPAVTPVVRAPVFRAPVTLPPTPLRSTPRAMPQPEVLAAAPPAAVPALDAPLLPRPAPVAHVSAANTPAANNSFAGAWFYPRVHTINKNPALYPPEYIETMITEEHGSVHGRYRARYQVADRAISPDVVFQFDGRMAGPVANLSWTGAGGARGLIHLKLISESSMEVQWSASELGKAMGLASGTAILRRRAD